MVEAAESQSVLGRYRWFSNRFNYAGSIIWREVAAKFEYLSDVEFDNIKVHKYVNGPGTVLDHLVDKYWWTFLANHISPRIHPNVLTLLGLVAALLATSLFFVFPLCRLVYLCAAILLFSYQSLDGVDGKQARQTDSSSPIGQMFDHGCDAITVFCNIFIVLFGIQLTDRFSCIWVALALITQEFLYAWWEMTYGIFRASTGNLTGVTEGQLIVVGVNILGAISPRIFTLTLDHLPYVGQYIPATSITVSLGIYICCNCILFMMILADFYNMIFKEQPTNPKLSIEEWIQIGFYVLLDGCLMVCGPFYRHPILTALIMCTFGSTLTWRIILSAIAKKKLQVLVLSSAPFYCCAPILCFVTLPAKSETQILIFCAIFGIAQQAIFCIANLLAAQRVLHIPLFTMPSPTISHAPEVLTSSSNSKQPSGEDSAVSKTAIPSNKTKLRVSVEGKYDSSSISSSSETIVSDLLLTKQQQPRNNLTSPRRVRAGAS